MVRGLASVVGSGLRTTVLVVRLMLHPGVPWKLKLLVPGALLYLLLPIDLLPDIIPLLGLADDLLALMVALALFLGLAPRYVGGAVSRGHRSGRARRAPGSKVVEGTYLLAEDDQETTDGG